MQLELGTEEAEAIIDPILDAVREDVGDRTVLVGGPPCQAYSLVGRARNRGNTSYVASEDSRHFLYREYIRILQKLRPAAFVMENVKGLLSAKVDGERIFHKVLGDLRSAGGGPDTYRIFPLSPEPGPLGQEHLIHAEKHGIPQTRHRVILFGIGTSLWSVARGLARDEDRYKALLARADGPREGDRDGRGNLSGHTPSASVFCLSRNR